MAKSNLEIKIKNEAMQKRIELILSIFEFVNELNLKAELIAEANFPNYEHIKIYLPNISEIVKVEGKE